MATISVKRLRRVLCQMFDAGSFAGRDCDRQRGCDMVRKSMVDDCMKELECKKYLIKNQASNDKAI